MSRLAFCMADGLLHEAARKQKQIAAALAIFFIYIYQLYDTLQWWVWFFAVGRSLMVLRYTSTMSAHLLEALTSAKVYDLAHTYRVGMPHHPVHPAYLFGLTKAHGEYMRGEVSSAAEAITLGGHVGTHIDALCHFSKEGKVFGGVNVGPVQSYAGGVNHLSIDTVGPIMRRGVLLDIAAHQQVDVLPIDLPIGPEILEAAAASQSVEIREGDVVLIRTGWATYWNNPKKYIAEVQGPGIDEASARWLSAKGIFAAGSDTIAFEFVPSSMPVHAHFLVEKGIHIMEALNMEQLAADHVAEFVFIAIPLKLAGGTGSPIRPIALV
jgi:kynurenine formamidase